MEVMHKIDDLITIIGKSNDVIKVKNNSLRRRVVARNELSGLEKFLQQ